ncbi:MAG TPA: carbohydrate binding domain-containing protein, partial [Clostridia bacterium]
MSGIKSKILRKVTALLSVSALLLVNVPICSAAVATTYHETFASGTGAAKVAGGAQLSAVTGKTFTGNDDGAALYVSNRSNNWDGADFKFSDIGLQNGKTYTITVKGYVDPDTAVPDGAQAYLQAVDSYSWINGANLTTGAAFTLTGTYTVDTSKDSALRVQSNDAGKTVPFMIGDITVTGEQSTTTQTTVYHEAFTSPGAVSVAGGAQLSTVTGKTFTGNDDGNALYVSNRANNWDGADFKFSSIGLQNGQTYTIKVTGYVDADAVVPDGAQAYLQAVDSYSWINGANLTSGAAFTLTGTYTVDTSKDSALRVQSNDAGSTVPFYIGDILITGQTTSSGDDTTTRPPAQKFTPITFEDQTANGFTGRGGVETLEVTNEAAHNGAYSLKVTGRTQSWNGPSLNVDKYIDQGNEYTITAWVKLISPSSTQLSISTQVGNGDGASYVNLQSQAVSTDSGWVQLQGKYRYNNTSSNYETIYVESSNATASFYIDDISFEKTGGSVSIQDLTPMKDVYKNFLIGDAISEEDLQGVRLQLLTKHCNVVTEGNAMKPESLQPTKGNFVWTSGDGILNKAKAAGLKMHGHVLVWH